MYLADIRDFKKYYDKCFSLLPEYRREKVIRFKGGDDKMRSICAGMLIRRFVGDEVIISESGKPQCKKINFNVSHSGDYVVIALNERRIGVDIERISDYKDGAARRICTDYEYDLINGDAQLFYHTWTRKESVIKTDGRGLSMGLNTFAVLPLSDEFFYADGKKYSVSTTMYNGYSVSAAVESGDSNFEIIRVYPSDLL